MKKSTPPSNMDSITKSVYDLVISNYKTIKAFSDATKLPYSTVSGIFNRGIYNTNISTVLTVCKELNLSIDALFNSAPQQINLSSDEKELLSIYNDSPAEMKDILISFISALVTQDTSNINYFNGHKYIKID